MHLLLYSILVITSSGIITCSKEEKNKAKTKDETLTAKDVVFLIRNERYKNSIFKAEKIKDRLLKEAKELQQDPPTVLMLHEEWAPRNAWTMLSIFSHLHSTYSKRRWMFFCEDTTELSLSGILKTLSKYNRKKKWFLGHALYDTSAAIIHHFNFYNDLKSFPFPDFDAGWAMSMTLLKSVAKRLSTDKRNSFTIDVKHEVAMYLAKQEGHSDVVKKNTNGTFLTDVKEFCVNKPLSDECVSTVQYEEPNCGIVQSKDILIAVKTCEKYHKDRVPIVQKTLGQYAKNIIYYSDKMDQNIPTEYIGVKNTEQGHCKKLHNIIKRSDQGDLKDIDWLVVVDDDTIMSFKRLQRLLACYDSNDPVILGERYGYGIGFNPWGYAYPTGGGGMVLSRGAVRKLLSSQCECMSDDSPDDMWLGSCAEREMGDGIIHTNSFHQAQVDTYTKDFLSHRYLVSFHKHQMMDPMDLYNKYLRDKENTKEEL